jgi:hypothetical protein
LKEARKAKEFEDGSHENFKIEVFGFEERALGIRIG